MPDLGDKAIVDPSREVNVIRQEVKIKTWESRIARTKQDIIDLQNMAIRAKEGELKMLELELTKLNEDLTALTPENAEIIDIN